MKGGGRGNKVRPAGPSRRGQVFKWRLVNGSFTSGGLDAKTKLESEKPEELVLSYLNPEYHELVVRVGEDAAKAAKECEARTKMTDPGTHFFAAISTDHLCDTLFLATSATATKLGWGRASESFHHDTNHPIKDHSAKCCVKESEKEVG